MTDDELKKMIEDSLVMISVIRNPQSAIRNSRRSYAAEEAIWMG